MSRGCEGGGDKSALSRSPAAPQPSAPRSVVPPVVVPPRGGRPRHRSPSFFGNRGGHRGPMEEAGQTPRGRRGGDRAAFRKHAERCFRYENVNAPLARPAEAMTEAAMTNFMSKSTCFCPRPFVVDCARRYHLFFFNFFTPNLFRVISNCFGKMLVLGSSKSEFGSSQMVL